MSLMSVFALLLALLPSLSFSVPQGSYGISDSIFDQIKLYEQYAAAAYCNNNFVARRGRKLQCPTGNCPRVEYARTTTTLSFSETPNTDTSGFVAIDETNSLIVVAFRGLETATNLIALLNISPSDSPLCQGCQVVKGLHKFWEVVANSVDREVRAAQAQHPYFLTVIIGHSLGGAIATYAAAELRDRGFRVDLITFGAPRVGNDRFVSHVNAQTPSRGYNFRVVHVGDPVPSIPPSSMGFRHPGPEYVITTNTAVPTRYASEIFVRSGYENYGYATPALFQDSVSEQWKAHTWYFNPITICYSGGALADSLTPFKNGRG